MGFRIDTSKLEQGLLSYASKAEAAFGLYAQTSASKLKSHMQNKAPWTDRTGHARQRLTAKVSKLPKGYRITLAHGVDYGIWLELAHEKNFAIIQPTINTEGSEVIKGAEGLLSKIG